MQSIYGRNIHEALPKVLSLIRHEGQIKGDSASVGPISLMVGKPSERLAYGALHALCPFTALFTALWTLGGRNDAEFLAKFDGYRPEMSDDGRLIPAAYGKRMRGHFWLAPEDDDGLTEGHVDQLQSVVLMLRNNPETAVPVISLWDTGTDLGLQSPNTPRATHLYLSINEDNLLDMMVSYRSAHVLDLQLDSVVFSMIHEYIASASHIFLGRMSFVINSLTIDIKSILLPNDLPADNPYKMDVVDHDLVSTDPDHWLGELSMFLDEGPVMGMRDPFFRHVAAPMWQAWMVYKDTADSTIRNEGARKALEIVSRVRASDWRAACEEWLLRKIDGRT